MTCSILSQPATNVQPLNHDRRGVDRAAVDLEVPLLLAGPGVGAVELLVAQPNKTRSPLKFAPDGISDGFSGSVLNSQRFLPVAASRQ
jgi:hypothetical protein